MEAYFFLDFLALFYQEKRADKPIASVKQRKCEISLIILRQSAFSHASELLHNFFWGGQE
ncbi:MAG: hypothetical protein DWP98_12395 [Bacteroidetes bacterium]|nr:MAG: hypothetical protein DWP98_12395 [Bacteroidota bacterium]MBL1145505.1 hypothetical protein [Bacteroidota bacterium]